MSRDSTIADVLAGRARWQRHFHDEGWVGISDEIEALLEET